MKLRIMVFDQEHNLRELLRIYLAGQGHEVMTFRDPMHCPLYRDLMDEQCCCPREIPCADAILFDMNLPAISALDFLRLQRQRGCKTIDENKAVMSAGITGELEVATREFGCHHIRKPFSLASIRKWTVDCAARVVALRAPQAE